MFPSRFPWLYAVHIAAVVRVILVVVCVSKNPLALLALNFLPEVPMVHDPLTMARAGQLTDADAGRSIGFTPDFDDD